jgi:pyrroline-5-carboxylate reductase
MNQILPPLLLIGGGKMGSAMLSGWLEQGVSQVAVIDPSPAAQKLAGPRVAVYDRFDLLPPDFRPKALILAVKPQVAATVLPAYQLIAGGALAISIMAGITIADLQNMLGLAASIVRAMPNTPAAIRQSITVATAQPGALSNNQRDLATRLLASVGDVAWVEDESLIDPITAVSGSGPAYVFLLAECLEQAAIGQGVPPDLARRLARQTITGSGNLLAASAESAAALRENVTSPGGTTAAAVAVLLKAFPTAVNAAIAAGTARSRELSATAPSPGR